MRKFILAGLALAICGTGLASDNVADCEVLVQEPITLDGKPTGAFVDTYIPASDFIGSVYDSEDGHLTQAEGKDIRVLFCTRNNIIPTLRDFPLLATGIPFAVSTDFDTPGTPLIYYFFAEGKFAHAYEGPDLSEEQAAKLADAMEIFNLQPHNLGK